MTARRSIRAAIATALAATAAAGAMRARVLLLAMLVCAALPMAADARPRVVVDADMSFDDAAPLAYLAQAHRHGLINLDAVTVSLSGAGYTGRGLSHARCLLRKHGLPGVPASDGDALGANPLPEAIRSYVDRVVHNAAALSDSAGCPDVPTEGRAARVLTVPRGRLTLIVQGPLTNLAQALARDPSLPRRISSASSSWVAVPRTGTCAAAPATASITGRSSTSGPIRPPRRSSCARASCIGGTRSTRRRRSEIAS
jgi:hypothetical protein